MRKQTKSNTHSRNYPQVRSTMGKKKVDIASNQRLRQRRKPIMKPVKSGDKLYLITRRDIAPGYQAVQSCHVMRQFTADHPDRDAEWFKSSNYLALLSVETEVELMRLLVKAADIGLRCSAFREPDIGGQITAIAIEPSTQTVELCKNIPLALKEVQQSK